MSRFLCVATALAASVIAGSPAAFGQDELQSAEERTLSEGQYAEGELLWTFDSMDFGGIMLYLTSQADGPHVQVYEMYAFDDVGRVVVHTSTPPCRLVSTITGNDPVTGQPHFDPVIGLSAGVNPDTGDVCPSIAAPGAGIPLAAVEPNHLLEQYGRAKIPNDTAFPSQWPLDNRGQVVGYVYHDANNNDAFNAGEGVYLDVNANLKIEAEDQLIAGAAGAAGAVLKVLPGNIGFKTWLNPGGGTALVFYRDVDGDGLISVGDVRVDAGGLILRPPPAPPVANGSIVKATDGDATVPPASRMLRFSRRGTIDADIDAPQAWVHNTDCDGFIIAVIDSGIDLPNLDLRDNLWVRGGAGMNQNGASFIGVEKHDESVAANRVYDNGEGVYVDADSSNTVTVGDQRLTTVGALAPGAVVAGDADIGTPLVDFPIGQTRERFVDLNSSGSFDSNEPIYNDRNFSGAVDPGDILLKLRAQLNGSVLVAFPANQKHADTTANMVYDPGETVYSDVNANNMVDAGDVRLTPSGALAPGAVAAGDADVGTALVLFRAAGFFGERHADAAGGAADAYDAGEFIYNDIDNNRRVSAGDRRRTPAGPFGPAPNVTYPANSVVAAADRDVGTALVDFRTAIFGDSLQDTNGHGTWCSSVIGARGNNGIGLAGVCWKAKILTLRVVGSGRTHTQAQFLAAMNMMITAKRAGTVDVRIVNYSHGRKGAPTVADTTVLRAADMQKLLFVCAAGNDGTNNNVVPPSTVGNDYPACYTVAPAMPNVITVGSSTSTDTRAHNFGSTSVSVGAPGLDVPVLTVGGNGAIQLVSGSSFASPCVAGVAAQAMTLFPAVYAAANGHLAIRTMILSPGTVDDRFGLTGSYISGKQNSGRARMVQGADFGDAPDPNYPTLLASNGARHEDIGEEWLGKAANLPLLWFDPPVAAAPMLMSDVSPEFDAKNAAGQPNDPDGVQNLIGNDANNDGVEFLNPLVFSRPGFPRSFKLRVYLDTRDNGRADSDADGGRYGPDHAMPLPGSPPPGVHGPTDSKLLFVNVWVDFNRNGNWTDPGEHVLLLRVDPRAWVPAMGNPVSSGAVYTLTVPMPPKPANAMAGETWVRVRLDYGENAGQRLPANNELFFTNFVNPFTAPGGLYRDWTFGGGLPLPLGGGMPAALFETPAARPPAVNLTQGLAQFGEVEDYKVLTRDRCPADVNDSGTVTVQDLFDFLFFYFRNDPIADINGDTMVTVQDVYSFLAAWFAGC